MTAKTQREIDLENVLLDLVELKRYKDRKPPLYGSDALIPKDFNPHLYEAEKTKAWLRAETLLKGTSCATCLSSVSSSQLAPLKLGNRLTDLLSNLRLRR